MKTEQLEWMRSSLEKGDAIQQSIREIESALAYLKSTFPTEATYDPRSEIRVVLSGGPIRQNSILSDAFMDEFKRSLWIELKTRLAAKQAEFDKLPGE